MSNPLAAVGKAFEWLGKEIVKAVSWVPKIVRIGEDLEGDAGTLMPKLVLVIDDVDELTLAAVKDGGKAAALFGGLIAAIVTAAASKGVNVASDVAVVTAFEAFVADVAAKASWLDVLAALNKLVVDYDSLGAAAKAAIAKLEAEATS